MASPMNMRTLTTSEVVARTGFSRTRVYRLVQSRELAVIRDGHRGEIRILESSLEDYFRRALEQTAPAPSPARARRTADDVDAAILADIPPSERRFH